MSLFLQITEEDLKTQFKIVSFGHRKTLIRAIELLKEINSDFKWEHTQKKKFKEEELFERIDEPFIRIIEKKEKKLSQGSYEVQTMKTKLLEDNTRDSEYSYEPDSKKTLEHQHRAEIDGEY